jgi:hypothetical protein
MQAIKEWYKISEAVKPTNQQKPHTCKILYSAKLPFQKVNRDKFLQQTKFEGICPHETCHIRQLFIAVTKYLRKTT